MTQTDAQLRLMAMNYLSRREYGFQELFDRISQRVREVDPDLLEQVLNKLQQDGLQSDQRYAEMMVRSRADRGYGPMRIRQEMRQRGLAEYLVDQAMSDLEVDWFELARQQRVKKFGDQPIEDWKLRGKAGQYLQRRGFSGDQIRYAIEGRGED